jgi:drug/metabolite transporter (DMT)-like permease
MRRVSPARWAFRSTSWGSRPAYLAIDAGIGALILFGGVQLTMFAGAVLAGEAMARGGGSGRARHGGAGVAGLARGRCGAAGVATLAMLAAALGWGIYSLVGRKRDRPVGGDGGEFRAGRTAVRLCALAWPGAGVEMTEPGVALAVLSGAVTSGLGYALWYAVLPRLEASVSGLVQLSVPVIAMAGGVSCC